MTRLSFSQFSLKQCLTQLARDIEWVQTSPSILNEFAEYPFIDISTSQKPSHFSASELLELLNTLSLRRHHLLGIYYETLWQFILQRSSEHPLELIANNLQVQNQQRTTGEFDLILKNDETGIYIHRELAVKYYLGIPSEHQDSSPWSHWVGPGLKDRMDKKLNRLLNHQIRLSETSAGRESLAQFGIQTIRSEILLQGDLFYPLSHPCPPPILSSPKHLKQYWLSLSELNDGLLSSSEQTYYFPLPKALWLSPYQGTIENKDLFTQQGLIDDLTTCFISNPQPRLIALCQKHICEQHLCIQEQHPPQEYFEVSRYFIVPDSWLDAALKFSKPNQ